MIAFIIRRLLQSIAVMLAVAFIAFALFNFVGDPINNMVGQDTTQQDRDKLRQSLGLNDPFVVQFARFVGRAAQGNFGLSYQYARPVSELIVERLPATLELSLVAAGFALLLGIPMGIYTGLHRHSFLSQIFLTVSLIGISLPTFLIGILLILVFAVVLGWTPTTYDAHNTLFNIMASRSKEAGTGLFNVGGYSNKRVDELTQMIHVETDPKKRMAEISEAMKIHKEEFGHIPLHQQMLLWAHRDRVQVVQTPTDILLLREFRVR